MTRLPTPGGDDGDWGDILNAYLEVSHAADGTLNNNVVGTNQLQTSSVTSAQISYQTIGTNEIAPGAITNTLLDSPTQSAVSKANSSLQSLTAADSSVTVAGTSTAPTLRVGTLTTGQLPSSVVTSSSASLNQVPVANNSGGYAWGADTTRVAIGEDDYYASVATGTASTDTTNLAAAITATPAGGTLWLDGAYKINAALTFPTSIAVKGRQKVTYSGLSALPSGPSALSEVQGTSIEQTVAATDAIDVTIAGGTFHMQDIVVSFQSGLSSTGYGINCDSGSNVVNLYGASFDGCYVFGHDGNHYALRIWNSLEYTTRDFRSWGGGGILEGCSSGSINYGNAVHIHPYISLVNSGTAHGFARSSAAGTTVPASGGMLNLLTYIRPQCNIAGAAGTTGTQKMWTDSVGAAYPWYVKVIGGDLEASGFSNPMDWGPDTQFVGGQNGAGGTTDLTSERYGYLALAAEGQNATNAGKSVAFGRAALQSMTTGSSNVGIGYFALNSLTVATSVTAVGTSAGQSLTGVGNTGVGNTLIGSFAGYKGAGTSGNATILANYNTFVGYQSGPGSTGDPASAVAIGKNATVGSASSGTQVGLYAIALGSGTSAEYNGSVAIGVDHDGTSAAATAQDQIAIGSYRQTTVFGNGGTFTGGVVLNGSGSALATNATSGFTYIPTCAGAPTGTPTLYTGTVPLVYDSTDNRLYIYTGGAWSDAFTA